MYKFAVLKCFAKPYIIRNLLIEKRYLLIEEPALDEHILKTPYNYKNLAVAHGSSTLNKQNLGISSCFFRG